MKGWSQLFVIIYGVIGLILLYFAKLDNCGDPIYWANWRYNPLRLMLFHFDGKARKYSKLTLMILHVIFFVWILYETHTK